MTSGAKRATAWLLVAGCMLAAGLLMGYRAGSLTKGNEEVVEPPPPEIRHEEVVEVPEEVPPPEDEGPDFESEEGRLAAMALAEDNELLRGRIENLANEVEQLTVDLAEERLEMDLARAAWERARSTAQTTVKPSAELDLSAGLHVLEVNERLQLAVLSAGALQGIKPDMAFDVIRGDRRVARVRTVDVRESIAGAVVEELQGDGFLERGDRAIPAKSPRS